MLAGVTMACLWLGGCSSTGPDAVCADQARSYGADFVVAAAFETTVGRIRALEPGVLPKRWPELPDASEAVVCYLDGPIAKGPPPGPDGVIPRSFDRAVIGVASGHEDMLVAGYRDRLPVAAP